MHESAAFSASTRARIDSAFESVSRGSWDFIFSLRAEALPESSPEALLFPSAFSRALSEAVFAFLTSASPGAAFGRTAGDGWVSEPQTGQGAPF